MCYLRKSIVIFTSVLLMILVLTVALWTGITVNQSADVIRQFPIIRRVIVFTLCVGFTILLLIRLNLIDTLSEKQIQIRGKIIWLIILAIQFLVIVLFKPSQITDAFMVNDQALSLASGIDSAFDQTEQYYCIYKNNNLLTLLLAAIYKVLCSVDGLKYSNVVLATMNVFCIDSAIFLLIRIAKNNYGTNSAFKVLFLSALNPLTYFLCYWFYSLVFSLPIMIIPIYLAQSNRKTAINWGIIGIVAVFGYFIRPTILIPVIALLIFVVLKPDKNVEFKQHILNFISMLFCGILTYCLLSSVISQFVSDDSRYLPMIHWYMMGMHGDGGAYGTDISYIGSLPSTKEMVSEALANIRWTRTTYTPLSFSKHQLMKLARTWTDGSGDFRLGLYSGMVKSDIYDWICGEKADILLIYCQMYRFAIYALLVLVCFYQIKNPNITVLWTMLLVVLGGFLFYMLWEAKPIYNAPFIQFIIFADSGMNQSSLIVNRKKVIKTILCGTAVLTVILGIILYKPFTGTQYNFKEYSLYCQGFTFDLYTDCVDANTITQTFTIERPFNSIDIEIKSTDGAGSALLILADNDGNVLATETVSADDIVEDYFTINIPTQTIASKETYTLSITEIDTGLSFYHMKTKALNLYDGICIIDGKPVAFDLNMNVYNNYSDDYMSPISYAALIVIVLVPQLCAIIILNRKETTVI